MLGKMNTSYAMENLDDEMIDIYGLGIIARDLLTSLTMKTRDRTQK